MAEIEYFYSTHSAYAYLGAAKLAQICAAHGCRLIHRPINLSAVVNSVGGLPFANRTQAHVDYFFGREIERWAQFRGVPVINHRPTFHDNALNLSSGMLIAAEQAGHNVDTFSHALLRAHWVDDIDLADSQALSAVARHVGLDPTSLLERALTDAVQDVFAENTHDAIRRNVFGSPTYVLEGEMFYGQDHLELLEYALTTPFPPSAFHNPDVGRA